MTNAKKLVKYYDSLADESWMPLKLEEAEKCESPAEIELRGEIEKLGKLCRYESELRRQRKISVAGVDEAGRGPIAGPVVAAAVVFDKCFFLPGLDDSKRVNERVRELLYKAIQRCACSWAVGIAGEDEIDFLNIHNASLLAMRRAVEGLGIFPDMLLIDGLFRVPDLEMPQECYVGGDLLYCSISAASIIAKVTRDKLMEDYDRKYPGYCFSRNKGYCTPEHREALLHLGPSPVHRRCYGPVRSVLPRAVQLQLDIPETRDEIS